MSSRLVLSSLLVWGACAIMQPSTVMAQTNEMTDEEKQERFSELAVEARAFYDEGDYAAAIERLQLANMLILDDRIMFNIGASYEKMDDCVNALAYYDAALRVDNPSEGWPEKIEKKRDAVEKECPDYSPNGLTGRISIDSVPRGATVKVDGETMGKTPFEVILLPDGRHTFQVGKSGYKTITEKVVLGEKADLRLDYELEEIPDVEGPDPFEKGDEKGDKGLDPVEDPDKKKINIPAIAMIGVGAVGLGVGGYINWVQLCNDDCYYVTERAKYDPDSPEFQELTEERQNRVVIMAASTTVGALLVAGGAGWLIYDMVKKGESDSSSLIIAPAVSQEGAGVGMHLRF